MKGPILLATMALSASFFALAPASAQSCPAGTTPSPGGPGGPQPCIPISDYSGGGSSGPTYATRWGAFAVSDENKVGMASGMPGKGKAKKAAIEHCIAKGGTNCTVKLTYYNQCGLVIAGKAGDGSVVNFYAHAATIDEASKLGMTSCTKDGLSDCKVFFSDCSYAELVG